MAEVEEYDGQIIDTNTQWYPDVSCNGAVIGRCVYVKRLNVPESQLEDRKIFRKVVGMRVKVAASTDECVVQVKSANERELRRRFPQAWQAFSGDEPEVEGIPIRDLKFITEDQRDFLKLNGISVVEQLAGLSDARCQYLGFGWRTNRTKAQEHLKAVNEQLDREERLARLKTTKKPKAA
jgi:hypothetical protein